MTQKDETLLDMVNVPDMVMYTSDDESFLVSIRGEPCFWLPHTIATYYHSVDPVRKGGGIVVTVTMPRWLEWLINPDGKS